MLRYFTAQLDNSQYSEESGLLFTFLFRMSAFKNVYINIFLMQKSPSHSAPSLTTHTQNQCKYKNGEQLKRVTSRQSAASHITYFGCCWIKRGVQYLNLQSVSPLSEYRSSLFTHCYVSALSVLYCFFCYPASFSLWGFHYVFLLYMWLLDFVGEQSLLCRPVSSTS